MGERILTAAFTAMAALLIERGISFGWSRLKDVRFTWNTGKP